MRRKSVIAYTVASIPALVAILLLGEMTPLGYDRIEIDLTTGRTRYAYKVFGVTWRTTPPDGHRAKSLWLARDLAPDERSHWQFMSYLTYSAPRVNTNTGRLWNDISTAGQFMNMENTEQAGRDLLAEFIRTRMRSMIGGYPNDDRDWAEMQHIFDRLDTYDETLELRTQADVQSLIDEAERHASS